MIAALVNKIEVPVTGRADTSPSGKETQILTADIDKSTCPTPGVFPEAPGASRLSNGIPTSSDNAELPAPISTPSCPFRPEGNQRPIVRCENHATVVRIDSKI